MAFAWGVRSRYKNNYVLYTDFGQDGWIFNAVPAVADNWSIGKQAAMTWQMWDASYRPPSRREQWRRSTRTNAGNRGATTGGPPFTTIHFTGIDLQQRASFRSYKYLPSWLEYNEWEGPFSWLKVPLNLLDLFQIEPTIAPINESFGTYSVPKRRQQVYNDQPTYNSWVVLFSLPFTGVASFINEPGFLLKKSKWNLQLYDWIQPDYTVARGLYRDALFPVIHSQTKLEGSPKKSVKSTVNVDFPAVGWIVASFPIPVIDFGWFPGIYQLSSSYRMKKQSGRNLPLYDVIQPTPIKATVIMAEPPRKRRGDFTKKMWP